MPNRSKTVDPASELRKKQAEKLAMSAKRVADEAEADILFVNSEMDGGADRTLIRKVVKRKRRKNLFLILVTEGGSAECAFRIARCLQECYEGFTAVVPGWCKSAGTLVCIGAYDLIIGDLGELGPLDVQLAKLDELGLISSGLTIDSAFRSLQSVAFQMFETFLLDTLSKSGGRITTKFAAELASKMTIGMISPIFEQMDPMKIGEDFRSTRIAEQYALRLDMHLHAQNLVHEDDMDAVEALVRGYPSHGFVIDRTEAEALFQRVSPLEGPLADVVDALGDSIMPPLRTPNRRPPVVIEYLTNEETDEERTQAGAKAAAGGKSSTRKGPGEERHNGDAVSPDHSKSDGNVPVPLPDEPARKTKPSAPSN